MDIPEEIYLPDPTEDDIERLRVMYPGLSEEDLRAVADTFDEYIASTWKTYSRWKRHPVDSELLPIWIEANMKQPNFECFAFMKQWLEDMALPSRLAVCSEFESPWGVSEN